MKKILDILSGISSFNGLSERQIEEFQGIVVNRHFNKGQIIFSECYDLKTFILIPGHTGMSDHVV